MTSSLHLYDVARADWMRHNSVSTFPKTPRNHGMLSFLEEVRRDQNYRNVLRMSIGYGFIYFGLKTSQGYTVPLLGSLGSLSLSIAYFGYAFANLFVPSMVSLFRNERFAMACAAMEYPLYTYVFVFVIPWFCIFWSFIHGFSSSVFWACQGVYLSLNSNDSNRGRLAGMFWSIYMTGAVFGNICALIVLKWFKVESSTGGPGWNGPISVLFLILGSAVSIFGSVILFGAKPAVDSKGQEVVMKRERKNVLKEVATVLKMAGTPRMACLTPLFLCLGFQSIFVNSMYNRQIDNKSNIALFMIVYTVTEVVCGFIHGWCIDTVGLFPMLVLYVILGVSALLLSFWADRWQSMVFIPLYLLFSVTDSGLQTFCLTVVGRYFKNEKTVANAVFRMYQSLGGGLCYILGSLFVSPGATKASPQQLKNEIGLCMLFFVTCFVSYSAFYFLYERRKKDVLTPLESV